MCYDQQIADLMRQLMNLLAIKQANATDSSYLPIWVNLKTIFLSQILSRRVPIYW